MTAQPSAGQTALERVRQALEDNGRRVSDRAGRVQAQCPAHEDHNPSLALTGIDGQVLVYCHAGCATRDVLDALRMSLRDLYDQSNGVEYQYNDGRIVHRMWDEKTQTFKRFRQSGMTKTPPGGCFLYHVHNVTKAVEAGDPVYVVEGEKDVHALEAIGVTATCNPMGAGKALKADWTPLQGADVVIVADADEPGDKHARQVVELLDGIARSIDVKQARVGKDAADHVAAGHGVDELDEGPFPVPETGGGEHGNGLYTDVASLLAGGLPEPPSPVLLRRVDGHALFYAGQVNVLFGDPESGKTLVAQATAVEALRDGRSVLFIDIDHNGPEATVYRLLDMGAPHSALRDPARFRYVEPEDKPHLMAVVQDCHEWRPTLAVVDSVGELLPLMNLNSNSPDDFTLANTSVLKPLAKSGAAVIAIDHLAKNTDSRNSGQTGTAAKKRAAGGVSLRVTLKEQFAPGRTGSAVLTINKDRHGGLRKRCPAPDGKEQSAGVFEMTSTDQAISWRVKTPTVGESALVVGVTEEDLTALDELDPPPAGVRDVKVRLKWRSDRAANALRTWRTQRSPNVPGEQGTDEPKGDANSGEQQRSPFPTPGSGNAGTVGKGDDDNADAVAALEQQLDLAEADESPRPLRAADDPGCDQCGATPSRIAGSKRLCADHRPNRNAA